MRAFFGVDGAFSSAFVVVEILVFLRDGIIDSSMMWVVFEALGLALDVEEDVARAYEGGAISSTKYWRAIEPRRSCTLRSPWKEHFTRLCRSSIVQPH